LIFLNIEKMEIEVRLDRDDLQSHVHIPGHVAGGGAPRDSEQRGA